MLRTANALPCQSINQFIQESLQACYLTMVVFITETIQGQITGTSLFSGPQVDNGRQETETLSLDPSEGT